MGVDFMINYNCPVKEQFGNEGLLQRVKAGDRARIIRDVYAKEKENRRAEDMGFEMVYRNAQGEQETTVIKVDELDALSKEIEGYDKYCADCPANRLKRPYGCIGNVNYPISGVSEVWMLQNLPDPSAPIPFLLLQQGRQMGNTGVQAEDLRDNHPGVFFESTAPLKREYPEMDVTGEQLFELMFLLGPVQPKRAVMILLFMGAIQRDMEADKLMALTPAQSSYGQQYPFLLTTQRDTDQSIRDLTGFFHALYTAWLLDRDVWVDV